MAQSVQTHTGETDGRPPGLRGVKFRLVKRRWYLAYELLEPLNRLRVAISASRRP